jgi:hypothetical protein
VFANGVGVDGKGVIGQQERSLLFVRSSIKGVDGSLAGGRAWFPDLQEGQEGQFGGRG